MSQDVPIDPVDSSRPATTPVLPARNKGGPATHKTGCICRPGAARRRREEAVNGGARATFDADSTPAQAKDVIEADLHPIIVKDRSARSRIADWAMMRATEPGITNKEIAKRLGIGEATLNVVISRAARDGWLKFDDPMSRLEHEIMPQAVDNLKELVRKKDKQATMEVVKGIAFPQFKETHGIQEAPSTVLAIKIENAPLTDPKVIEGQIVQPEIKLFTGNIVGKPKGIE